MFRGGDRNGTLGQNELNGGCVKKNTQNVLAGVVIINRQNIMENQYHNYLRNTNKQ